MYQVAVSVNQHAGKFPDTQVLFTNSEAMFVIMEITFGIAAALLALPVARCWWWSPWLTDSMPRVQILLGPVRILHIDLTSKRRQELPPASSRPALLHLSEMCALGVGMMR